MSSVLVQAFRVRYKGRPDRYEDVLRCAEAWEALKQIAQTPSLGEKKS